MRDLIYTFSKWQTLPVGSGLAPILAQLLRPNKQKEKRALRLGLASLCLSSSPLSTGSRCRRRRPLVPSRVGRRTGAHTTGPRRGAASAQPQTTAERRRPSAAPPPVASSGSSGTPSDWLPLALSPDPHPLPVAVDRRSRLLYPPRRGSRLPSPAPTGTSTRWPGYLLLRFTLYLGIVSPICKMLPKDTFDNLQAKVQMCFVRIIAMSAGKPTLFAPGIVIAKKKLSCYVITDKGTFCYGSEGLYAAVFPGLNMESVAINFTDVSIADSFASFMLSKPKCTNPLAAVKICESGPLINEDVYTLGYQNPKVPFISWISPAIKDMLQPFMDQKNVLLEKRKPPVDTSAGASKKSKTTR
uniref:Uncharacterized protein n=1 Tax=Oryza barthii TaxID=65489 RepID=A0A0D3F9N7_9ORYZ